MERSEQALLEREKDIEELQHQLEAMHMVRSHLSVASASGQQCVSVGAPSSGEDGGWEVQPVTPSSHWLSTIPHLSFANNIFPLLFCIYSFMHCAPFECRASRAEVWKVHWYLVVIHVGNVYT